MEAGALWLAMRLAFWAARNKRFSVCHWWIQVWSGVDFKVEGQQAKR
jgi:hypothetical protein